MCSYFIESKYATLIISGAISGVAAWVVSFPQDVIKTNIQLDMRYERFKRHAILPDGGVINCAKFIWSNEGKIST